MDQGQIKVKKFNHLDEVLIRPLSGYKKTIKLNRTHIKIILGGMDAVFESMIWHLPHLGQEKAEFDLTLISIESVKEIFCLKSTGENFLFRHNGNLVKESLIEKGDIVEIGANRLEFNRLAHTDVKLGHNISSYATSPLPVCIVGETGTGKGHLAQKIHLESGRSGEFVHLNLSSFAPGLIESELFGHVKGAYTGAIAPRKGALEQADRGTLFLDEIDSLPLELQTKLLLFFDNKIVRVVGGNQGHKVDVRLIIASGRPLEGLVESGQMRKDFYFRILNGIKVCLPRLKDQPELIEKLSTQMCLKHGSYLSASLLEYYKKLEWPGNIRQFLGHLEKKIYLSSGKKLVFDDSDMELDVRLIYLRSKESDLKSWFVDMASMKKAYASFVYGQLRGDHKLTQEVLKITFNTLRNYLGHESDGQDFKKEISA